jgi:hypothetical protein
MKAKNIALKTGVVIVCLIAIHAESAKGYRTSSMAIDTNWSDYTYNLTIQPILTYGIWQNAFVYFRVSDWLDYNNGINPVGYRLAIWGPHNVGDVPNENLPGSFHLRRINSDGSSVMLFQSAPNVINTDGPINLSIALSGRHILISSDSNIALEKVDIDAPDSFLHGGIGVGAVWESEARFDNVLVTGSVGSLFSDNFNSGVPKNDWVSITGTQWVEDGWLHSTMVPEPATLFLLGLGSLVLLRK